MARRGLDKYHPSERNLDTPVTAESEGVALFTDTHSDYTPGLKSLIFTYREEHKKSEITSVSVHGPRRYIDTSHCGVKNLCKPHGRDSPSI